MIPQSVIDTLVQAKETITTIYIHLPDPQYSGPEGYNTDWVISQLEQIIRQITPE